MYVKCETHLLQNYTGSRSFVKPPFALTTQGTCFLNQIGKKKTNPQIVFYRFRPQSYFSQFSLGSLTWPVVFRERSTCRVAVETVAESLRIYFSSTLKAHQLSFPTINEDFMLVDAFYSSSKFSSSMSSSMSISCNSVSLCSKMWQRSSSVPSSSPGVVPSGPFSKFRAVSSWRTVVLTAARVTARSLIRLSIRGSAQSSVESRWRITWAFERWSLGTVRSPSSGSGRCPGFHNLSLSAVFVVADSKSQASCLFPSRVSAPKYIQKSWLGQESVRQNRTGYCCCDLYELALIQERDGARIRLFRKKEIIRKRWKRKR